MANFRFYIDGAATNPAVKVHNMDAIQLSDMLGADIEQATSSYLDLAVTPQYAIGIYGSGFTFDADLQLTAGTIGEIRVDNYAASSFVFSNLSLSASTAWQLLAGSTQAGFTVLLAGDDTFQGSGVADLMRGYGGRDTLQGGSGADSLFGGTGDDLIYGGGVTDDPNAAPFEGSSYLRGEEGNDTLHGSFGFDDIHGNMGNDIAYGRGGNDWVVGGKDQDKLYGDAGDDVVLGNMGLDTLEGGAGNDTVRGGQDDDILQGGDGHDWLSGDRGSDTITGGLRADIFHSSKGAGLDRITDFNRAEGDRVVLDLGTTYSLRQIGADTVIDMGGGDQVVLVGVNLSSLSGDWLGVFP